MAIFVMSLPKGVGNAALHIAKGYSDSEIPENALEIVRKNERVTEMQGELDPIGKMTVLEGYVSYSKNFEGTGLPDSQLEEFPLSGGLFVCRPSAKGTPINYFKDK